MDPFDPYSPFKFLIFYYSIVNISLHIYHIKLGSRLSVCLSAFFLVTQIILWSLHQSMLNLHKAKVISSGIMEFISESFKNCSFSTKCSTDIETNIYSTLVSRGQTAFSVFICGGGKKGLVWFTHASRLRAPTVVGGDNRRNVIKIGFKVAGALKCWI